MTKRSSFSRIDEQVYFCMAVTVALSILILGFRFATTKICRTVYFNYAGNGPFTTDDDIEFKALPGEESYEWDFGDGSPVVKGDFYIKHKFKKQQVYTVTLRVSGNCEQGKDITISHAPEKDIYAAKSSFDGPKSVYDNIEVTYTDNDSLHTSWKWGVDADPDAHGSGRSFRYTFKVAVPTVVWVQINGDENNILRKSINVTSNLLKEEEDLHAVVQKKAKEQKIVVDKQNSDQPHLPQPDQNIPSSLPDTKEKKEEPPAPVQKYPEVSAKQFGDMIIQYSKSQISSADFEKYFCGQVSVKYKNKFMYFPEFLGEVKNGKGKIKEVNVQLEPDQTSNCIKKMTITLKRSKFLGIVNRD